MRVVLTIVAVQLLQIPFLKIVGAGLLFWIGVQLLADSGDGGEIKAPSTIWAAIRTILVADLVMSLDNVIAVASAAEQATPTAKIPLLLIGLGLSIPLIVAGSTMLIKLMEKFPVIVTLGGALLGFLAGEMIATDPAITEWVHVNIPHADFLLGGICAVGVTFVGLTLAKKNSAHN
jgi:YjbE family integral membrane protein